MTQLAIYYEHPQWFEPLFRTLETRGIAYKKLSIHDHRFDPADASIPAPVIFNRLAMSSFLRQSEHALFYSQALLAHWAMNGARVINGTEALAIDTSKARQLSLFCKLGLATPATRVIHRREDVIAAAADLTFPIILKPNIGGSGTGVVRVQSLEELQEMVSSNGVPVGVDGVTLVQDYVPARNARVIRLETLNGKFLYAIALDGAGATFDLCPADVCMVDKPAITISAFTPSASIIAAAERVAQAAHLDIGGIEYMIDDRDGEERFYDINALSNFVAKPIEVLGYDPHEKLVDYLVDVIADGRGANA